jgi:hypothetical protein
MRSIHRSILKRLLMTGAASLAVMIASAAGARAEIVTVQGDDGATGANAVNSGEDGMPGGDGESVAAYAGSPHRITSSQNQDTATGGSGGAGGNGDFGVGSGSGGFGGNGGAADATASTTIAFGSAKANGGSFGGNGGAGGNGELFGVGEGGNGGNGGAATATAGTTAISGTAEANTNAYGGAGGSNGSGGESGGDGTPGLGGSATATSTAMTTLSGAANSSANAIGGTGGPAVISQGPPPGSGGAANAHSTAISGFSGDATSSATAAGGSGNETVGPGGDASASSAATSNGSGNALSSASATGGDYGAGAFPVFAGDATAMANAFATVGGTATAKAVAVGGTFFGVGPGAANATSTATTARGALAQAQSTAFGSSGQAKSTAKTSLGGVSVQSSALASAGAPQFFVSTGTTNAIAQGGSGQAFVNPGRTAYAFSTGLPDKAYATTLIGGASNVADALLGPRDMVFGTAILGANYATDGGGACLTYSATSTFDFAYGGNLQLGLIDDQHAGFPGGLGFQSMEFTILDNGVEILDLTFESLAVAESFFDDSVINLGSNLGPNIDLTFGYTLVADGSGGFGFELAIGGAVPESSTWAMMLIGFGGLGFAGYRRAREPRAA